MKTNPFILGVSKMLFRRVGGLLFAASLSLGALAIPSIDWTCGAAWAEESASEEREAFEAAKELGTVEAWDAFLSNYPKGFRADLARAYVKKLADTPAAPAPSAGPPVAASAAPAGEYVTLGATPIRVGKWPERAAFDGSSLWVSESGARSIVEIDLQNRSVGRRLKVGRLPVDIVATENGTVYALAETDNMLYAVARGAKKAGEYADVPRCADILSYADNNLWVVSNLNCSTPSVLTRVSHLNGRTAKVADLAGGTTDMKVAHGFAYVGHMSTGPRAAFLSIVDTNSGSSTASPDLPIHFPRLAANASAVFVGGAPVDQNVGIVLKLSAGQSTFVGQQQLPEPIASVGATEQYVIAVGRQGTIFVLNASDLGLVRTIRTNASVDPHDVLAIGNTLVVVSSRGNEVASDNVVYLIDGWVPGSPPMPYVPPQAEPQRREPVAAASELKCAKGYKKVRGECVMVQNCGANAYRSPEGDCYCNKNYDMKNGKCVRRQKQQPVVDNCPGDSVLKNGRCVKEDEPDFKPPIKCSGGQLYSLSQQRCACQDGLKWNGQRCYLP
ncbi:MAG: hypothetical protein WC829_14860 [Hyphomicrobium sp.]|jgi:hypothetical protein